MSQCLRFSKVRLLLSLQAYAVHLIPFLLFWGVGREGGYTITKFVSQKGGKLIDLQIRHRIKGGLIATTVKL